MSIKVDFMCYTHFGYDKDLKSNVAYFTVKESYNRSILDNIIVIDYADTKGINKERFVRGIPGGKNTSRLLYLVSKMKKNFKAREYIENFFDNFGSKHIDADILYCWPRLLKSIEKAQKHNSITVLHGSTAHPNQTKKIGASEHKKYSQNSPNFNSSHLKKHIKSFEGVDYIFALSTYAKETYIEQGIPEDKIATVIGMGVDTEKFIPTAKNNEEFNVLLVADMPPMKGVIYLLDAWTKLNLKNSKLYLVGGMTEGVKRVVEKYKRKDGSIVTTGHVTDTKPYYDKADIFVMPSLSEAYGKVILEAMASGLPVIATTNTGARDVIDNGEQGFIVPIRDSEAMKDKIQYLYDNPSEINRMGKNAKKVAEENTWDHYSERVADALEKVYELKKG